MLNATSVQASWELPSQLGPIQGFKVFHCKLPAAHFEGPLLLASTVSSFLYTDLREALNLLVPPPECGLAPGTELPGPARPVPFTISCFLQSQPPSIRSSSRHSVATGMVTAVPVLSLRDVPLAAPGEGSRPGVRAGSSHRTYGCQSSGRRRGLSFASILVL